MLTVAAATQAGGHSPNEDLAIIRPHLFAVLDGATVRTGTGCVHGVPWYVDRLAAAFTAAAEPDASLVDALAAAISAAVKAHPECELTHPGTPSAGIGVVRIAQDEVEWLVLGDVTVVIDTPAELHIVSDDRVSKTAAAERAAADMHPIGSPEKAAALLPMKHAELAARNRPGGYWIAAADPSAAAHSLIGSVDRESVRRIALLSDGAARAITFGCHTWEEALVLLEKAGPTSLISQVREAEAQDPLGLRWPRNKVSDDATVVFSAMEDSMEA